MENRINYSRQTQKIIERIEAQKSGDSVPAPRLLLHSCCAPCSSHCMEYLREYFRLTVFYYNPIITVSEEYEKRLSEEKRLIAAYDPENWFGAVRGLEHCPEGGDRCTVCFEMRLRKAAQAAAEGHFDFFTTTLTISPLKDAQRLNAIGQRMAEEYGTVWLPSDFKKKDGYKRSIELSRDFDLYRQNYCGCVFSQNQKG